MNKFKFSLIKKDNNARAGFIQTSLGEIKTPIKNLELLDPKVQKNFFRICLKLLKMNFKEEFNGSKDLIRWT